MTKAAENNNEETILGIDYGEHNIGLAFGRNGFVSPLKTVPGKNIPGALNEIAKAAVLNKVKKVIVGLPLNYDGKETMQSKRVRHFSKLLKVRLKLPVSFIDEYGTTTESLEESIEMGVSKKRRKVIDHFSAAIILKKYYQQQS